MLLEETELDTILTFSNEQLFFRDIHPRFKFCLLTFKKGSATSSFRIALYDKEIYDKTSTLGDFLLYEVPLKISAKEIRLFSPNEFLFIEFRKDIDIQILRKMTEEIIFSDTNSDFHLTNNSDIFRTQKSEDSIPLYGGKNITHFLMSGKEIKYWIDENEGRNHLLKFKQSDHRKKLGYQYFRLVYRSISTRSNERTLVSTILPPSSFCDQSLNILSLENRDWKHYLFVCAVLNSFCFDYIVRLKVNSFHVSSSLIEQTPLPPTNIGSPAYRNIVDRAAKLICTTPEFDDLAAEVGLGSHTNGITDTAQRAQLRAELDGMIAPSPTTKPSRNQTATASNSGSRAICCSKPWATTSPPTSPSALASSTPKTSAKSPSNPPLAPPTAKSKTKTGNPKNVSSFGQATKPST